MKMKSIMNVLLNKYTDNHKIIIENYYYYKLLLLLLLLLL